MNKKEIVFTVGLTLLMGIIWIAGELVMGLWLAVVPAVHIFWMIGIVVVTLIINVIHSMKEDKSAMADPKRQKYERKTQKRKDGKR